MTFLRNLVRTPFAMAMGLLGVLSGVRGLLDPTTTTLYLFLGAFAYAWSVVYGVGGVMMLFGMGRVHTKSEAAGCVLFAFGAAAQAVATAVFVHRSPLLTWYGVCSLLVISLAAYIRSRHLIHGERLVWLSTEAS